MGSSHESLAVTWPATAFLSRAGWRPGVAGQDTRLAPPAPPGDGLTVDGYLGIVVIG